MNTTTHALLPVIAAGICECSYRIKSKRKGIFSLKQLVVIGVLGAAPDLINPYLTLEGRYLSWSHSIWFWLLLTAGLAAFAFVKRKLCPVFMVGWLSFAYFLHIICDAISGGVAWGFPITRQITGSYYIKPSWWIPLDVFVILFAYGLFRIVPKLRTMQNQKKG